jgi:hypothetical protein
MAVTEGNATAASGPLEVVASFRVTDDDTLYGSPRFGGLEKKATLVKS